MSASGEKVCALTGAQGYVGSILRRGLESAGWSVVSLSRRGSQGENEIRWSLDSPGGDLHEELRRRQVSALVHAAWDLDLVRPRDLERVNVQGSLRLFDQAAAAGVRRCVFISTISAYQGARSHYGRTKLAVERAVAGQGGAVIRPGLVFDAGGNSGGMFGALRRQVRRSRTIPLIGKGSDPQYLVHGDDLAAAVERALEIEAVPEAPVTVAHPQPWTLRALLEEIAGDRTLHFLSIPWPLVYSGLKAAEVLGLRPGFRSDSVISLVYQNPQPDWNADLLGVKPRPFSMEDGRDE